MTAYFFDKRLLQTRLFALKLNDRVKFDCLKGKSDLIYFINEALG